MTVTMLSYFNQVEHTFDVSMSGEKPGHFLALRQNIIVARDVNPRNIETPSKSGSFNGERVIFSFAGGSDSDSFILISRLPHYSNEFVIN